MKVKGWTSEEIGFFKNNYPDHGRKYCAEKLNKTNNQIAFLIRKTGIKSNKISSKEDLKKDLELYRYKKEGDTHFAYRKCSNCQIKIEYWSVKRYYLLRDVRKADKIGSLCNGCSKSGDRNHFYGKKHTDKTKDIQSKNRKGKACGSNNSMANPKYRKKVSDALKKKYDSGDLDYLKKIQRDTMIKSIKNGKLKCTLISKGEIDLKKELENKGCVVNTQYSIGTLKYDLIIKSKNIIIEYNGDYWHCNPEKYASNYFNEKKKMYAHELWKRDYDKKKLAEDSGFVFITIWEKDYKLSKEKEIEKIIEIYEKKQ